MKVTIYNNEMIDLLLLFFDGAKSSSIGSTYQFLAGQSLLTFPYAFVAFTFLFLSISILYFFGGFKKNKMTYKNNKNYTLEVLSQCRLSFGCKIILVKILDEVSLFSVSKSRIHFIKSIGSTSDELSHEKENSLSEDNYLSPTIPSTRGELTHKNQDSSLKTNLNEPSEDKLLEDKFLEDKLLEDKFGEHIISGKNLEKFEKEELESYELHLNQIKNSVSDKLKNMRSF